MMIDTSRRSSICGARDAGAWSDAGKAAVALKVARHRQSVAGPRLPPNWPPICPAAIADRAMRLLLWLGAPRSIFTARSLRALVHSCGERYDFATLVAIAGWRHLARRLGQATIPSWRAQYRAARTRPLQPHRTAYPLFCMPHTKPAVRRQLLGRHHTGLLRSLSRAPPVPSRSMARTVTYPDPCYLGGYNGEIDAPRRLLVRSRDADRVICRHESSCCGWSGRHSPMSPVSGAFPTFAWIMPARPGPSASRRPVRTAR